MNISNKILHLVENLGEDTIELVSFAGKFIVGMLLLFVVVVLWDTLPSTAPIANYKTTVVFSTEFETKTVVVADKYTVVKLVDLEITRSLVNTYTDYSIKLPTSRGNFAIGEKLDRIMFPIGNLDKGEWCMIPSINWINGLSIAKHEKELPKTCFEVK